MMNAIRALAVLVTVALAAAVLAVPATAASSGVKLSQVLSGYTRPVLVTHAGGSSRTIFIVEQTGKIKRATFKNGSWKKLGTFLDLTTKVTDPRKAGNNERGLLGLAFHPNYKQNGRFYVNYTRKGSVDTKGDTVIAEYRRSTLSKANPSSRRVLMVVNQPFENHNGGHLAFGPDGYLYIGLGDGGGSGDPRGNGQKLSTRLGKLLRISPLDPDGAGPKRYKAPSSNPRVGKSGLNDIWAWGLRNPWRFSFDRKNGNLWIGDVGQSAREEVDRSRSDSRGRNAGKGKNYGWSRCEGTRQYPDTSKACTFTSSVKPVHEYSHDHHDGRCSVTGGYVHRGPGAKAWRGLYVVGDYCGRLFVLTVDGKVKLSKDTNRGISSFGEDTAGRIFATDVNSGKVFRVRLIGPRP